MDKCLTCEGYREDTPNRLRTGISPIPYCWVYGKELSFITNRDKCNCYLSLRI